MYNFYKDMNNLMDTMDTLSNSLIGFGVPSRIRFNTGSTKDMMPAVWKVWKKNEGTSNEYVAGYKAVCRTVGIDKDDVNVVLKDNGLEVSGETVVDGTKYTQHVELPMSREVVQQIDGISYFSKDGLTYIFVLMKNVYPRAVDIQKVNIAEDKDAREYFLNDGQTGINSEDSEDSENFENKSEGKEDCFRFN